MGYYSSSAAEHTTEDPLPGPESETEQGAIDEESSSGGPMGPQPDCFADDFEGTALDDSIWNTWNDAGSGLTQESGVLRFFPPSSGLRDVGIVSRDDYTVDPTRAWVTMKVNTPPDAGLPVLLALKVMENHADGTESSVAIRIVDGAIRVDARLAGPFVFQNDHPEVEPPGWMGIRGDGALVHFEVSEDGINWTTIDSQAMPASLEQGRALVMVQTYGDAQDPPPIDIGHLEACIEP